MVHPMFFNPSDAWWSTTFSVVCKTGAAWCIPCFQPVPCLMIHHTLCCLQNKCYMVHPVSFNLSNAWWFTALSVVSKTSSISSTHYAFNLFTQSLVIHHIPVAGNTASSYILWFQPVQTQHKQFTTCLLPAIQQVHTSCGFSLCKHNTSSSPHACCQQYTASSYILWFQPVQTRHRQLTTCLLPAIRQVHTSCGFSLCKHNTSSSPHACCRLYCKFIHPVVSACANTTQAVHHMLVTSNTASSYILWFQPVQTQHKQFTTCLLPAIWQVHTSCGFSLCNNIQARQFTTCLLPAIQQAPITHNVFSLPRKCCLQVHIITHTTLPASW